MSKPATTETPKEPTPLKPPTSKTPFNVAARAQARKSLDSASEAFITVRRHAARAASHPVVDQAQTIAKGQLVVLRDVLGRSESVRKIEGLAGVDRVYIVGGGLALFTALVPFNMFGLANATTTLICFAWPTIHALAVLDSSSLDKERTRNLMAYFVILGYLQVLEGLFGGLIEAAFSRYYLLKLTVMFYLGHCNGAARFYDIALKNLLAKSTPRSQSSSFSDLGADYQTPLEEKPSYKSEKLPGGVPLKDQRLFA